MSRTKPDIAIPFQTTEIHDCSIAVIAVRPESNKVSYESVILRGVSPHAELIYMANLSGTVVRNAKIIESQYKLQYKFAKNGKSEIMKYPELQKAFHKKFNIKAEDAPIIGAFEAVTTYYDKLQKTDQELFQTIVDQKDLLEIYGHTIKKIGDFYIVDYDIPAIFSKYNNETDIFVIAVKMNDKNSPFTNLNRGIYEEFEKNQSITIIDSQSRSQMKWFNRVKRTYHISSSHIKAMFDMTNYILDSEGNHINFEQTPLGNMLLTRKIVTEDQLRQLKDNPMVTIKTGSKTKLINILTPYSVCQKSLEQCCDLINKIVFTT